MASYNEKKLFLLPNFTLMQRKECHIWGLFVCKFGVVVLVSV